MYRLAVKRSQQELARGHPVEVIGPETRRLPHRWRYGHGTVEYPAETDGAVVRIFSLEPSLVELLPGLRAPAYQVEAVLCHQASYNPFADVGVYVAHAQYTTADGPQHFFVKGRFAELGSQALAVQGPDGQFGGEFKLDLWHLGTTPGEPYRASYTYKPGIFFRPKHPRQSPGEWQTVRVEVRRDVFRLIWEGKDLTISRDREVPQWIEGLKNHYPDLTGFDLQLPAHGALGIYLHGSSVLVRRLTVTPLETDG